MCIKVSVANMNVSNSTNITYSTNDELLETIMHPFVITLMVVLVILFVALCSVYVFWRRSLQKVTTREAARKI